MPAKPPKPSRAPITDDAHEGKREPTVLGPDVTPPPEPNPAPKRKPPTPTETFAREGAGIAAKE